MNNAFVRMQAKFFAERLRNEAGIDPTEQIDLAFQLTLSRKPTLREKEHSLAFFRQDNDSLIDFSQAMLNLNEFVYIN